jgi:uncharacterized membrane protein YkoI
LVYGVFKRKVPPKIHEAQKHHHWCGHGRASAHRHQHTVDIWHGRKKAGSKNISADDTANERSAFTFGTIHRNKVPGTDYNSKESPEPSEPSSITEEKAKEIALKRTPGKVTDIDIERKYGQEAWVVEIDPTSGPETDVIIDMQTGKVLGIED